MSRCIILHQNESDSATITVANTATNMGADNLKTDTKSEICRVLSNSARIDVTFPATTSILTVVIPAHNFGASSTIRVRAYSNTAQTTQVADSGTKWAAPGQILAHDGFTRPLNVNRFAYSLPPITAVHFPQHVAARSLRIDITDPDATFLDMSRLIIGPALQPRYAATYGVELAVVDQSANSRAASGDLRSDISPKSKKINFSLEFIADEDRAEVRGVIERGIGRPLFVSLVAGCGDPVKERDYSIYGKPTAQGQMSWAGYHRHSSQFSIEGF